MFSNLTRKKVSKHQCRINDRWPMYLLLLKCIIPKIYRYKFLQHTEFIQYIYSVLYNNNNLKFE